MGKMRKHGDMNENGNLGGSALHSLMNEGSPSPEQDRV